MTETKLTELIDDAERRQAKVAPVGQILQDKYGPLQWQQGQDAMDELISCILSQNTSDTNRDRGFYALKERYPGWQDVVDAPTEALVETIRSAGLANQKAPRIQNVLRFIYQERGAYEIEFLRDMPLDEARDWLVSLDGIGPKTAAIVLCFAFGLPAFPVDTHIYRVTRRIGILPEKISVEKAHVVMEALVPPDEHYAYHIYLIRHGRDTCKARKPLCDRCPVAAHCDYFESLESDEAAT